MATATLEDIAGTIRTYIATQWGATTPIKWPNQGFNPKGLAAWIAPHIRPADTTRDFLTGVVTTGQVQHGLVVIQIFVRPNTPTGVAEGYFDDLAALFNEVDIPFQTTDLIRFKIPSSSVAAQADGEPWFQITLTVEYTHDDSSA